MRYLARALAVVGAAAVLVVPMVIGLTSQPEPLATASPTPAASPTASPTTAAASAQPSAAPSAPPTTFPEPVPLPSGYVQLSGLPFAVIDSADADVLFATPDTCVNAVDGYRLTYPDTWYTNTQFGSVPPCSWFSPTYYEVQFESDPPDDIVIVVRILDGGYGYYYAPTFTVYDFVNIDGFEVWRREEIAGCYPIEGCRATPPTYTYWAMLGLDPLRTLVAITSSEGVASYELNKAVLDRIMASLEFFP